MSGRTRQRRSPPRVVWLVTASLASSALICALLGFLIWRKAAQVRALEAQVQALQVERQTIENRLSALQSNADAMEDRLATLEASDPAKQLADLQLAIEQAGDTQQLDELRGSLTRVQSKLDAFQARVDELSERMDALSASNPEQGSLPAEVRLRVAPQRQEHNLSCESAAASMTARYQGIDLSEAEILAALPRNENPNLGFRGNIDGPTGGIEDYGVYAGPILEVLTGRGVRAWSVEGGLAGIRAAVARGNPVIAWVTYQMQQSTPVTITVEGQEVTLVPNQHVVVVTGYGAEGFWANDPWEGGETFYTTDDLTRAMGYFGDMAIEVAGP